MKKLVLLTLILCLLLMGCASGVSQEEYDSMVAERNEALAQIEVLKEQLVLLEDQAPVETPIQPIVETEPPAATVSPEENFSELLNIETVKWHKHYINADHYHCDLIVTNNSQQLVEAQFSIKYFDASGNVIGVGSASTEALGPGASHLLTASNESPYEYAEVSISSAKVDDAYNGSMENVVCNDYIVNGEKVIFEATNNGNAAVEFVRADVLFYNGDEVVDHDYAYATDGDNELKPGATLMAEVSTSKSFTSYRIFYYGRIS